MNDNLKKYIRVKAKTHVESLKRLREIHQDVVSGKMSLQEAKVCIDEEEESTRNQLQVIRDFYDLTDEDVKAIDV